MIEKFERFGIVHFSRNESGKLVDIYYLQELRNIMVGDAYKREDEITIKLLPKRDRSHNLQPHYTKKVCFDTDVELKAGIDFMASVWYNDDGSIDFKLTPLVMIQQEDGRREGETLQVGALIKKLNGRMAQIRNR